MPRSKKPSDKVLEFAVPQDGIEALLESWITIEAIQLAVAEYFGMSLTELKQISSARTIAVPRQIAMYLVKQMTDASLPEIGREFGGKHHTTVMHSIAKIDEQRRTDVATNKTIENLLKTLTRPTDRTCQT
jgi:chromosomal replication initiator protein